MQMPRWTSALLAVAGLTMTVPSTAAGSLADFRATTKKAYATCSFRMSAGLLIRDEAHIEATRQCVDSETAKAKASFELLIQPTQSAAASALKDYFAAWTGGMRALPNLQLGSAALAERADDASTARQEEFWIRVEIEAGI